MAPPTRSLPPTHAERGSVSQYTPGTPFPRAEPGLVRRTFSPQIGHQSALSPLVMQSPSSISSPVRPMSRAGMPVGAQRHLSPQSGRTMSPAPVMYSTRPQVSGRARSGSSSIPPPGTMEPRPIWAATPPAFVGADPPGPISPLSGRPRYDPIRSSISQSPSPPETHTEGSHSSRPQRRTDRRRDNE